MKKASDKLSSKPSQTESKSFVDELSESQLLQEQLRAIVRELKATVETLERNLHEARSSAQSQRQAKAPSAWKTNPSEAANEPGDESLPEHANRQ
jgi:Zn-dependent M32 family carboxypeptidase